MVKEKKQTKDQVQEMKELLQRTQANFENYRKQNEKRVEEIREMAAKDLLLQLFPILDNFELALKNTGHINHDDFIKGVELIYAQFDNLLGDNKVEKIQTKNQKFDPYFHEALMKEPSDLEEGMIIEEFQRGFTLQGNVIRHSKVKVSAGVNGGNKK